MAGSGAVESLSSKPEMPPDHGLDFRNLRNSPPTSSRPERAQPDPTESAVNPDGDNDAVDDSQNTVVDLGRLAWLGTVVVCLIVVLILALEGYYGYAAVTFAVAFAAGINLA
jgi:hypothetical protein